MGHISDGEDADAQIAIDLADEDRLAEAPSHRHLTQGARADRRDVGAVRLRSGSNRTAQERRHMLTEP
jgi:hypothetical protein